MVATVHRAARVIRGRLTAAAWAQLRSPRPGGRARRRAGHRDREGAGLALHALPRPDPVQGAERAAVAASGEGDGVAGAATCAAARRRDAPRHRGRVRVVQADAVPALARRVEGELYVPGLGEPVQAHRGRLLHPGRAVRPGPVPDLCVARPRAARAARALAGAASRRERRARRGWRRAPGRAAPGGAAAAAAAQPAGWSRSGPALDDEVDSFWNSGPALIDLRINPFAVEAPDTLLRQLGPISVDAGGQNLVELLAPAYRLLAERAERRALE